MINVYSEISARLYDQRVFRDLCQISLWTSASILLGNEVWSKHTDLVHPEVVEITEEELVANTYFWS